MKYTAQQFIEMTERYGAHNYKPLDVVLSKGKGVWVWDVEGNKYMDMLSSYSALNHGHCNEKIIRTMKEQLNELTLTSRAFRNNKLPLFLKKVCEVTGMEMAFPMNSGAEAVETALKAARKWGHKVKGIPDNKAEIIVAENNFHGRTITIISFSTEKQYKDGFGPLTPGFKTVPYGKIEAIRGKINDNTAAVLLEPVQGEGGILIPPEGYLREVKQLCKEKNVLFMLDEIQSGLGRTGKLFAWEWDGAKPDVIILGKALGGGVYPVSVIATSRDIMGVFTPGDHGSTFGGNPVAAVVGVAALDYILEENLTERANKLGNYFMDKLRTLKHPAIKEIRGKGLLIGMELKEPAREYAEKLQKEGILCKETHSMIIRFAPPLVITKEELDWAFERIKKVFS
ncbi:ornithine--oxo-acid transaminase [candidate division WOR-3 bacterium]|nr:ornithine--oxo-acid transaminase [candidate division WOR-3 bacterium]MCK4527340.1 ornithine--oxo-acid transaminase [candidate division WOR-3 bacterium]